ncbi:hypothetical protein [Streptomyces sp. Da 82-17]|uniref:hypothetical protein n=1 Tax=Streptomyces sp. Da 82-17 TaxID=3377116 RepID=UPI0038D4EAAE
MSPRVWPPVLDWTASTHWDYEAAATDSPRPCVLCGKPSLLLSDDGKPCHKACAEDWFEQHPDAWAAFEKKRDLAKAKKAKVAAELQRRELEQTDLFNPAAKAA